MPRIIDAFTQFLDDNGDPLVEGFLKFIVSGTNNTDKDTFADINETIANSNPVKLTGSGRCPNIFGTGSYNVVSYTSAMVQIQQFDPVGGDQTEGALATWDAATIYAEGNIVTGSDGLYYRSLITANENQDPTTSPDKWEEIKFVPEWNTNIEYSIGDAVYGSDGFHYTSRTDTNTGNDPIADTTNWRPGVNEIDLKGADIVSANDTVLLDDGNINDITGAVTVNGMTTPSYGNPIRRFHLDGAPLLKHDTAPSAGFSKLFIVGGAVDYQASVGDEFVAYYDGTYWRVLIEKADGTAVQPNPAFSITATIATNDLTLGLGQTTLNFRSATLTDGIPVSRTIPSALSLVVPDTATLESVNAIQTRVYLLAIDNAGTVELAVVNSTGGVNLNEEGLISTTAISTGADSNDVIYSTTARSNVAYRVVGLVEYTQATAGTYATAPSLIQGMGGNALTSMSSLGYGQTWQSVTRAMGTTYYNSTGKPIVYNSGLFNVNSATVGTLSIDINGVGPIVIAASLATGTSRASGSIVIPIGASYVLSISGATAPASQMELR